MTTFSLYLLDEVHEIVYKDSNVHGNQLRQYGQNGLNRMAQKFPGGHFAA